MKKIMLLCAIFSISVCVFTGCSNEEFVVTLNPNGGEGAMVSQHFTQKIAQPLMANPFTKWGFKFSEWNTHPDGNGAVYKDREKIIVSEHKVLYAQWVRTTGEISVTFDANRSGGEYDSIMVYKQTFEAGMPQNLAQNTFQCEGYYFINWNTHPNGFGQIFEDKQYITIFEDLTLYAQWKLE